MKQSTGALNVGHIALIGNFLPRKCGIATFTTDTYQALRARFPEMQVDVYAMDDHPGQYDYPEAVVGAIPQHDRDAYVATASGNTPAINAIDVINTGRRRVRAPSSAASYSVAPRR